ncbi:MAG TPA: hypothetical protein VKH35_04550, partial [Thermoanaerobaculia bacterium]|nr:hypothetical protein [Thermoanaerobaculia bacterium]
RFSVDAYPDEEFRGRIAQIRYNATVNQNVVTYPVIVEVPNPDEKLRPKMTANVTIDVATVHDVLRIPNSALRFKPAPGTPGVPQQPAPGATASAGNNGRRFQRGQGSAEGNGSNPERALRQMARGGPGITGAGMPFAHAQGAKLETIWLLQANNTLKPVAIRAGITDGHNTQVVSGEVKPGDNVVVGLQTSKVEGPPPPGGRRGPMGR